MAKKRKAKKLPFSVRKGHDNNVVLVDHGKVGAGFEQWYLLRSDAHQDNPKCNRELEEKHLNEAIERNAGILDFGDIFCAMQGKYDKRSSKESVRPEHQRDDYLDSLIETAAERYAPYAQNWVAQGYGNHETSIAKRHETDLIQRMATLIKYQTGYSIPVTGYTGWVRFQFSVGTSRQSYRLWHIHGYGGGGPVTKDMIQRNRMLAYVDNADIICSGHTHDSWVTTDVRVKLNDTGRVVQRQCKVIKCPTYKEEYRTGTGGWHVETGKPPKPIGAWWLRFFVESGHAPNGPKGKTRNMVKFEIREAT